MSYFGRETLVIMEAPKKAAAGSKAVPDLATRFVLSSNETITSCFMEPIL